MVSIFEMDSDLNNYYLHIYKTDCLYTFILLRHKQEYNYFRLKTSNTNV